MGGFVIIGQLIVLFFVSAFIALVCSIYTLLFGNNAHKKRKVVLATGGPFLAVYTFYIVWTILCAIVADFKRIDFGSPDSWLVPVSPKYELLFIDVPEVGMITADGAVEIDCVAKVCETDSAIYVKCDSTPVYSINTKTDRIDTLKGAAALVPDARLYEDANTFYSRKHSEVAGFSRILIMAFAMAMAYCVLLIAKRLIMSY